MKYFLPVLLFLAACSGEPEWKEVTVNSRVQLSLPEGLMLSADPNPNALAHYEDTMKSIFLLVIPESKDTMKAYEMDHNLSTYFDEVCRDISSRLSGPAVQGMHAEKIGDHDAYIAIISGTSGTKKVQYVLAGIESPRIFYQLITAYPAEDSLKLRPQMEKILRSFREL